MDSHLPSRRTENATKEGAVENERGKEGMPCRAERVKLCLAVAREKRVTSKCVV